MNLVPVELGSRSYVITIDSGTLDSLGQLARDSAGGRGAYVITDSNVGPLYADRAVRSLTSAGYATHLASFPAGEANKTLATVSSLFDQIFAAPLAPDRDSLVVALGGGVVGDVAGFVAATLLRGVNFIQAPTTLLADVDSSVGGKTGVDHPAGKNLIGAFHQPKAVVIDTATLATLPKVELASGLAECVKHGVLGDASLVDWIDSQAEALLAGEPAALGELIARNVRIKASVVSADERESGVRAHLNLGHTIGHAIEAMAGFDAMGGEYLRHGHCVALGLVAANRIATARGLLPAHEAQRIESLLTRLGLPTRRGGLEAGQLLGIMRHDKKSRAGAIRFVLARHLGEVAVYADVSDAEIVAAIAYLAQ